MPENAYTVVRDWSADWWDEKADEIRCTDAPQVFYVWAPSASDASDEAEAQAVALFGAQRADYLSPVAVLHGHASLIADTEARKPYTVVKDWDSGNGNGANDAVSFHVMAKDIADAYVKADEAAYAAYGDDAEDLYHVLVFDGHAAVSRG